jgi:hypothetical protein
MIAKAKSHAKAQRRKVSRTKRIEKIQSAIRSLKAANRAALQTVGMARGGMPHCAWWILFDAYKVKCDRRLNRISQLIGISVRLQFEERHERWKAKLDRKYPLPEALRPKS